METLLHNVQDIEREAESLVEKARTEGSRRLREVQESEERVLQEVQARAQKRGEEIIKEHVSTVEEELNKLRQEEEQSVTVIHQTAKQNRERVLERARDLFYSTYIST